MNIALKLVEEAKKNPDNTAVVFPHYNKKEDRYHYSSLTFRELDIMSNKFALGLEQMGLKKGDFTLLFLRPSLEFSAMTFAIFKLGLVPVFIDPGMGRKNLLKCIKEIKPVGLISEKEVHYLSKIFQNSFKSIKYRVTTKSKFPFMGSMMSLSEMKKEKLLTFKTVEMNDSDMAAILYTSGGTGRPKGVVYTHKIFNQQTEILKDLFKLNSHDIDMPGFPLFSLFTITMGMKSIIPDMDPSKPSKCDPKKLYQNIVDQKPTFVAGSPAIWERLADYCIKHKYTLPTIKYLVMFGAPVSVNIHRKFKGLLPNGTTYTPYGATEALPVCNISGEYILKHTANLSEKGHGTCIGKAVPSIQIKIIKTTDAPILNISDTTILEKYFPGEIIVKGDVVTREYYQLSDKTIEAKIYEDDGTFWHRMGDLGFIDEQNQVWFLGRKAHRITTMTEEMFPIPCEAIFNLHPEVKRSALVGLGREGMQTPAIVIERLDREFLKGKDRSIFESELINLAKKFKHTENISKIYLSKHFPVDVRHNIKIDRKKLKEEIEHHELQ